ncbi:unnamed protein product [Symbiodinium sp. CCMP2592]|nr:unnamed protein product [Symbiodinium sp. CCMP2592]
MASFSLLWAWLFAASLAEVASTEFFKIRSALAPHKCITRSDYYQRFLELRECSAGSAARGRNSNDVWYFNKTWLVNLEQLDDGDGTLQAMCVTFDRAYYYHHGRPLWLRACQEGQPGMDWVWEDDHIRHVHTAYVFDLPGHNITDLGRNRTAPDWQDLSWFGWPQVQLGSRDNSTSSDQVFFKEILSSMENHSQSFEPLPATEVLPDFPPENYNLCPDGSFGERNVCPWHRRAYQEEWLCKGGTLTQRCVCFPGYFPLAVGYLPNVSHLGELAYTCCRGESNSDGCGDIVIWLPLAVALTILGGLGVLTTSLMIYCHSPSIAPATEEDLHVLCPQLVHDGAVVHRTVEQAKWGVSLDDLYQFKRLVHHAVKSGSIRPTDLDQFSASDVMVGPSAYTVNDQMIRPVTAAAGNVSWALMKHPEGCLCDLFVTHGWAEGVFDFVEKVVSSWPRAARGAYVCFLSNPQNLDIADLIQTLRVVSTGFAGFGAGMLYPLPGLEWYGISWDNWALHENLWLAFTCTGLSLVAFSSLTTTFTCCFRRATATIPIAIHCMTASLTFSIAMRASFDGLTNLPNLFRLVLIGVGSTGLEVDWHRTTRALQQADQLAKGFAGTVRQATSSSAEDLRRILHEIEEHEQVDAIDDMIASLIAIKISTVQTRSVLEVTGQLKDMSDWSRALFSVTALGLIWQFRQVYVYRIMEDGMVMGWLLRVFAGIEALLWPIIFLSHPVESKAFAERCVKVCVLLLPGWIGEAWLGVSFEVVAHMCVIPLMMILAALGPGRISRAPVLGPALIRMLFWQIPCRPKTGLRHPKGDQPIDNDNAEHPRVTSLLTTITME